ncbi:MAG TPA: hypothetical protein VHA53_07210 [Nitrolancea sp.]|nr:hypothetical protein [Nitrolancea sp.]
MRSHKFLAGAVTGVALVVLVSGLLLAGIGRQPANAAGGTPAADTGAKATAAATGTLTSPPANKINELEQQMIMPISDAEWNAAATTLGMTQADFEAAINGGQSVAALGAPRQVSVDQVRGAMVAAGTAVVNAAVHDGSITQADGDLLNSGIVTAIADKVSHANIDDPAAGTGTPTAGESALDAQKRAGADPAAAINNTVAAAEISALASTLGVSLDQIKPVLDNPAEMATLAASHHVTAQQLEDTLIAAGQQALDQAVTSGTISQSDADGLRTSVVQPMAEKLSHAVDAGS